MVCATAASSEALRVATFNTELHRDGPGLLLRDIARGNDPQIIAVLDVLVQTTPDIVSLQSFDYDLTGAALNAFLEALKDRGLSYPYYFAARPNTGLQTGLDMDGDGRLGGPRDAQGYGRFSGQGGMAVLSRHPILHEQVQDFTAMLWQDMEDAFLPYTDAGPFPSADAQAIQRLSTTAHWVIPINVPDVGPVSVLTFHASPPVFDGPEDRNGKRNHDEIRFWIRYLNGLEGPRPDTPLVLMGDANQDPTDGEGLKDAITGLLAHPMLQDPRPRGAGSDDPLDTVDWDDPVPGNLRVDYVLPSRDWTVEASGVFWPEAGTAQAETAAIASRHRLVWVDLSR